MLRYPTATHHLTQDPRSVGGDAVSAFAVNINYAIFLRGGNEDGAAARVALEPVDTERMLHRCHIIHYALSSHESRPFLPICRGYSKDQY